jgi:hypothetical protein
MEKTCRNVQLSEIVQIISSQPRILTIQYGKKEENWGVIPKKCEENVYNSSSGVLEDLNGASSSCFSSSNPVCRPKHVSRRRTQAPSKSFDVVSVPG